MHISMYVDGSSICSLTREKCTIKCYNEIGNVKENTKCFNPSDVEFCPVNWTLRGSLMGSLEWFFSYVGV